MIATTLYGLEEVLAEELYELGAEEIELLNRAVKFEGDKELMYKCNLYLRTAIKILKPIDKFTINNESQLYQKIKDINWERYMSVDGTLAVEANTSGEVFTHSQYVALKSKDAIVDQFRDKYNRRPSVDLDFPNLKINLHIWDTNCIVSLDSSGVPLGKRGYRKAQSGAPISEVLAAGIIYLSGWDRMQDVVDPMCGSGTFSIEAAMMAANMAPGRLRRFTFERWKDFDKKLWDRIYNEAERNIVKPSGKFFASDIDERCFEIAEDNANNADVVQWINFSKKDFLDPRTEFKNTIVFLNPPYGERMKDEDEIIPFYREIGTQMKHKYEGCNAWIISSNIRAMKFIGLKPSRKIKLFNGPLECSLQKFELFKGKKKDRRKEY